MDHQQQGSIPSRVVIHSSVYQEDSLLAPERWSELESVSPFAQSAPPESPEERNMRRKAINRTWPPPEHEQPSSGSGGNSRRESLAVASPRPQGVGVERSSYPSGRRGSLGRSSPASAHAMPSSRLPVPCRGASLGCNWTGHSSSLYAHQSGCALAIIAERLVVLESMNNMLRSKVEALQVELQEAEEWPIKYRELRLRSEIREWRLDPLPNFNIDASSDLLSWVCGIPGKKGTLHEGAMYELTLEFGYQPGALASASSKALFPFRPPRALLSPCFFHPNVFASGELALPLLADEKVWEPSVTIKEILLSVQEFLARHTLSASVQEEPFRLARSDPRGYLERLAKQASARRVKGYIESPRESLPSTPERKFSGLQIGSSSASSPPHMEPIIDAFASPSEKRLSPDHPRMVGGGAAVVEELGIDGRSKAKFSPKRVPPVRSLGKHGESLDAGGVVPKAEIPISSDDGRWIVVGNQRVFVYGTIMEYAR